MKMAAGYIAEITNTWGGKYTYDVLFSYGYRGSKYAVLLEPQEEVYGENEADAVVCRQIAWNPWQGTHFVDKKVPDKILAIGDRILANGQKNPQKYKFCGEHYDVTEEKQEGVTYRNILQCRMLGLLKPFAGTLAMLFRWLVAMVMAGIYAAFYVNRVGPVWIGTLFPETAKRVLIPILYAFQFWGVSMLFWLRKENRDFIDLFQNAIVPVNLVTMLGAVKVSNIICGLVIAVLLFFGVVPIVSKMYNGLKAKQVSMRRQAFQEALDSVYVALSICIVVGIIGIILFGVSGYTYKSSTSASYEDTEAILKQYAVARQNLNENVWPTLTTQQKIDTLQWVCDYECVFDLGCEIPTVQVGYPEEEDVLGEYKNAGNTITINTDHMQNSHVSGVLKTLLHETRHAWQYAMVEMYEDLADNLDAEQLRLSVFQQAMGFQYNFANYTTGSEDFDQYYTQEVEMDSRNWAETSLMQEYDTCIYIDKYLAEKEAGEAEKNG